MWLFTCLIGTIDLLYFIIVDENRIHFRLANILIFGRFFQERDIKATSYKSDHTSASGQ